MSKKNLFKALAVILGISSACASTYAVTANPILPLGYFDSNQHYYYYNSPTVANGAAAGGGYSPLWIYKGGFQYGTTATYGWGGDNFYKHVSIYNLTSENIVLKKIKNDPCTDNTASRFDTYNWPPGSSNPKTARIPNKWYWSAKFALNSGDGCSVAGSSLAQNYSYAVYEIYAAAPDTSLSQELRFLGQMTLNLSASSGFSISSSNMQNGHTVTNNDGAITIN